MDSVAALCSDIVPALATVSLARAVQTALLCPE
jgi:hypothetical protein